MKKEVDEYQFRRASTLAVSFEKCGLTVHNFLTRKYFSCNGECLELLGLLDDWHSLEDVLRYFNGITSETLATQIDTLIENDALVVKGTKLAELDARYSCCWEWGIAGGFFHFTVRNLKYLNGEKQREWLRKRRGERLSPPLLKINDDCDIRIALPEIDLNDRLFSIMARRRSQRILLERELPLRKLSDCLFSAKGVTGYYSDPDFGTLPLTMTPSGGARNPYELYVYARSVTSLEQGLYHYSGLDHDLGLIRAGSIPIKEMLAEQDWADKTGATIFLVAHFSRSAWKYHATAAYRIVLIEAGCILQNIALAATRHRLTAIPTGALNEALIEEYLNTKPIDEAVIFAIGLGTPDTRRQQPWGFADH